MEELVGPDVEVILTLREVTDLGFMNVPFFAVATLFENPMETDVYDPDTNVRLNTDLVWESTKANIKKMRNSNLPIKINFFKCLGDNHREKFGYVILHLKTAQYVPKNKEVKITEDYTKILGLGKEAKGSTPLLLKALSIRDKVVEVPPSKVNPTQVEILKENNFDDFETAREGKDVEESNFFNESEQNYKIGNVKIGEGIEVVTVERPPSPNRSPRTRHSLTSGANERRAILNSYEKQISSGDLQPQKKYVQAYHNYKLEIRLENILWLKVPPKFRFRFHQSRSEILSTAHPEITVERADEIVELCDIKATFSFVETPAEFYKLLTTVPPAVSISCTLQSRPAVIARGVLETDKLSHTGDETIHKIELIDMKSHETIAKLTYAANLFDLGPQVMKDVVLKYKAAPPTEEKDLPPAIFENVTEKIVDELEDWKERQKERFQHEFTEKLQKEMQQLREEWMEKRKELEKKVNDRMEQCRQLGNSLIDATEEVKRKNREIEEKERNLEATKSEFELRYFKLLTEKKEEAEKLQDAFQEKLKEKDLHIERLEKEKNDSEKLFKELTVRYDELIEELKKTEGEFEKTKKTYLSQDQTATLLQDLKTMQEKLEAANNSKLFFKEQWGRAVREIHRIKSEHTKNIQVQLQYRKDELKKLGLEQLFLAEKSKNNLERDDILEARDFLTSEFPEVRGSMSDIEFPYRAKVNFETFKTNMDIVKENNNYLLKFNQESEEKLKKLIEERDKLLCDGGYKIDDENIVRLNREIRNLLEH